MTGLGTKSDPIRFQNNSYGYKKGNTFQQGIFFVNDLKQTSKKTTILARHPASPASPDNPADPATNLLTGC